MSMFLPFSSEWESEQSVGQEREHPSIALAGQTQTQFRPSVTQSSEYFMHFLFSLAFFNNHSLYSMLSRYLCPTGRQGQTSQDPISDGFTTLDDQHDLPSPFRIEVNYGDEFETIPSSEGENAPERTLYSPTSQKSNMKEKEKEKEKESFRQVEVSDLTDEDSIGPAKWNTSNNLNRTSSSNGSSPRGLMLPSTNSFSVAQRTSSLSHSLFRPALSAAPSLSSPLSTTSSSSSFYLIHPQHVGPATNSGGGVWRGEKDLVRDKDRPGTAWVTPHTPTLGQIAATDIHGTSNNSNNSSSSSFRNMHDSKNSSCTTPDGEMEGAVTHDPDLLDDEDRSILVGVTHQVS